MRAVRALTLALLATAISASSHAQIERNTVSRKLNYGVMAGCGSTMMFMQDIHVGGYSADSYTISSDVGFILSAFGRVNIDRYYLQTGLSFYHSKSSISFKYSDMQGNTSGQTFSVDDKFFQIPFLFGVNLVKQEPYSLSLFVGPKLVMPLPSVNYAYYSGFGNAHVDENMRDIALSATIGVNLSISNILLCFGYDLGITPPSDGLLTSTIQNADSPEVVMKRRTGVLFFSLGLFL